MRIAIQPDDYGPNDASSPIWSRLLVDAGFEVDHVDVYGAEILQQLVGCHGFMWRHGHAPHMRQIARRLLPVIENELNLEVYPNQRTCWHYDDKIAQSYLLPAVGVPIPHTWIWYDKSKAIDFAYKANYPLVLKLFSGAGSTNVKLVSSFTESCKWIEQRFSVGVTSLDDEQFSYSCRIKNAISTIRYGGILINKELHKNYVLFQEFIPDNSYDTRVTVIGNRAFAYRRFNRPNDFRASGSGNFDVDPAKIDLHTVKLAFDVTKRLNVSSIAIDMLKSNRSPLVGEISYTYVSWMVHACPGHWDKDLTWHEGQIWPEEAQVEDFIARLKARFT